VDGGLTAPVAKAVGLWVVVGTLRGPVKGLVLDGGHGVREAHAARAHGAIIALAGLALCRGHVGSAPVGRHVTHKADGPTIPGRLDGHKAIAVIELLGDVALLLVVPDCGRVEPIAPGVEPGIIAVLHLQDLGLVPGGQVRVPAPTERRQNRVLDAQLFGQDPIAVRIGRRHIVLVGLIHLPRIRVHHYPGEDPLLRGQRLLVVQVRGHVGVALARTNRALQLHPVAWHHHNFLGLLFPGHRVLLQAAPCRPVIVGAEEPAAQRHLALRIGAGHQVAGLGVYNGFLVLVSLGAHRVVGIGWGVVQLFAGNPGLAGNRKAIGAREPRAQPGIELLVLQ